MGVVETKQTPHYNVKADMSAISIAGVLAAHMRKHDFAPVELRSIGPGAVNQAVKGVAIAAVNMARDDNVTLMCTPRLEDGVDRDGGEVSRVAVLVEVRS